MLTENNELHLFVNEFQTEKTSENLKHKQPKISDLYFFDPLL